MQNFSEHERSERITSRAEVIVTKSLRIILDSMMTGDRIQETDEFRDTLSAMEYFIPEVFREIHSEWTYESLDGVFPLVAKA